MNEPRDMTDAELAEADISMTSEQLNGGMRSLSVAHSAVKAELGRRSAERSRKRTRSSAGKKAAVTRARRVAAGLPPMRRGFTMDNAPVGGWTEADRVR